MQFKDDPFYYTNSKTKKTLKWRNSIKPADKVQALLIQSAKNDEILFNKGDFS